MFPYGAQYFRPPNPPESEWERDLKLMAEQGFTLVKFWAMWSWIGREEGKWDFAALDRLFEIAAKNGLQVVINTILENTPYWLTLRHPEAMYEASDGRKLWPMARSNTPGGGWPGLCMHNPEVRARAADFLTAVGSHFAEHPSLWGYDVWNEVFYEPVQFPGYEHQHFCYCAGSQAAFLEWLKERYGTIEALSEAWRIPYTDWNQVYPPRWFGSYPDWLDWLKFRLDAQARQMEWRIQTLRSVDPVHPLSSHGIGYTLHGMPSHLTNDFQIAPLVDQWGLSSFPIGAGAHASEHFRYLDLVRSASEAAGKRFWQNELQGGPAGGGLHRTPTPRAADTAFWNWTAFACGAKGLLYWQWRPELLGPESPGFGLCRADGAPTDRTEMAGWFAGFLSRHEELSEAEPIPGDMAILVLPESQLFTYVAGENTNPYAESVFGIYRALWDANLQVDFATINNIGAYPLVWLPFPLMIEEEHAKLLTAYVEQGGILISDALPAQYRDHGYTSFRVPGLGLDELFGCVEDETEFIPTGASAPLLQWHHAPTGMVEITPMVYQEKLTLTTGEESARYADGSIGMVDHAYGKGKTRLIGTYPGIQHYREQDSRSASLIRSSVMTYGGISPKVEIGDSPVKARLQVTTGSAYLYVLNTSPAAMQGVGIFISRKLGSFRQGVDLPKNETVEMQDNELQISLGPREGTVIRLIRSYEE